MDLNQYKQKMQAAVDHLEEELKKVRTGRAHPSILDGIKIEAYGTPMPLNQVSNVTAPEPQLIQITPFDPNNLQAIVTAIRNDQNLGLNPTDDGRVIRVPMPPLNEERRQQIVKSLSDTVEEARVTIRNIRHEGLKDIKKAKDAKEATEDDVKSFDTKITEMVGEFNGKIEAAFKAKEAEIMTV